MAVISAQRGQKAEICKAAYKSWVLIANGNRGANPWIPLTVTAFDLTVGLCCCEGRRLLH